jgi:hypothetical protein
MGKIFGTVDEYAKALQTVISDGVPEKHLDLLRAHCVEPRTAQDLAQAVGYTGFGVVNLQYGRLAHRVAVELGVREPPRGYWLNVLVRVDSARRRDSHGHLRFVLREEVIEALNRLGYTWARSGKSVGSSVNRKSRPGMKKTLDSIVRTTHTKQRT